MSRRWLLVAAGAAVLVGGVPLRDALPVAAGSTPADDLRHRILGSAAQPWVGLAEATGRVALPELPALESTTALFTGVTRVRGHVEGPDRWRADELTPVGERDVYRLDGREYVWDFGRGGAFLSAVVTNGQLFPAAALALVLPVFLPITVAIVAGDAVAGEASAGTLRYLLVRPVGRLRLLVAKLVSITVFVLLAVLFVTVTGYLVGVALFGFGPDAELGGAGGVTSLSGAVLSPAELLARTALVVGYLALCMLALGAVGLFFSTLTDSPLAAALGVLALVVASAALQPLDAAAALEPYLPTAHWLAWIDLYRDPILWPAVREGAAVQAGYVLVAFGAAWANLATKDITS